MKKIKYIPYLIITLFYFNTINAQKNSSMNRTALDRTGAWLFGVGLNMVEDSGIAFNIHKSLEFSNPLLLSTEYTFTNQFSFTGTLSFNKYTSGRNVDGRTILEGSEAPYVAFDVAAKYYFRKLLPKSKFEPHLIAGFGYTNIGSYSASQGDVIYKIPTIGRITLNGGLGVNYWFSNAVGANLHVISKWGLKAGDYKEYITNQVQFSLGVFYSPMIKRSN